ncbi:hypothetical protein ABHF54_05065 [Nitrosomonas europaea]|uniref:hypothetical protein n=1 Tax=Nitrosomonas europaea TaxID=915 RepID=UPI003267A5DD
MERDSLRNACLVFASALDGGISAGARRQGVALSGKKARLSGVALWDAVVVPAAAGLLDEENWNRLLQME